MTGPGSSGPDSAVPAPIASALNRATELLAAADVPSPGHDAEALLAHVLGASRTALRALDPPDPEQLARFDELVTRRAGREPLQHLLGTAAFRYVDVAVGPGVFVPRPETEVMTGWVIDVARAAPDAPVVVDLGTGSGAIALSVATEVPSARVYAIELDPGAYAWAEHNLAGSSVTLAHGDLADAFPDLDGRVDAVVANPPYIPLDAYESVVAEARDYDPALALWSGCDGLDAIRVVEWTAARLLRPGGVVACEHADEQGTSAPAVFAASGAWHSVRDHRDLADRPRFVTATRTDPTARGLVDAGA